MRLHNIFELMFLVSVSAASVSSIGCDQTVTDPPDGEIKTVEVVYNDGDPVVIDLADLEAFERDGEEYARLSDVVEAADLGVALEALVFDFAASDGFLSSSTSTCVDTIPMAGELLRQGYVHRVTRNLDWDVDPELPGCVGRLRDLSRILATDGDDVPELSVDVLYDSQTKTVVLSEVDVVEFEGADHVRLSDVVEAAGLGVPSTSLAFDFIASDGFRASGSSNCASVIPLPGDQLAQGYIDVSNRNLVWEESADMPGCSFVDDLAQIEATDLSVGPFVDVVHDGNTVIVDLGLEEVVEFEGSDAVRLLDVVERADLGVATNALEFDFVGSDGFRASGASTCIGIVPLSGDQLTSGFILLSNRNLVWDTAAGLPGCTYVDDLAQIDALDP